MSLRSISKEELAAILTAHSLWRKGDASGKMADLSYSNLRGRNLSYSNLRGSDLRGSDLRGSNLRGSDLRGSDLRGSDLRGSDLRGSNLSGSDLSYSNLSYGNFHRWQYYATSEALRIGCEVHTWAEWKKEGKAIATKHNCAAEFKAFWPVLDATRKNLQARFPAKKKGA